MAGRIGENRLVPQVGVVTGCQKYGSRGHHQEFAHFHFNHFPCGRARGLFIAMNRPISPYSQRGRFHNPHVYRDTGFVSGLIFGRVEFGSEASWPVATCMSLSGLAGRPGETKDALITLKPLSFGFEDLTIFLVKNLALRTASTISGVVLAPFIPVEAYRDFPRC
ncbi:hypothetical protein [Pseudosulfitobacter pseudonitzschiae]|uniref:hypothetical protein n=1 Tax=Pseudosulfitobacter pseudonitzschiae TaxID=1402135 RepID=UPI003B7F0CC9